MRRILLALTASISACQTSLPPDRDIAVQYEDTCLTDCWWNRVGDGSPIAGGARAALRPGVGYRPGATTVSAEDASVLDVERVLDDPALVVVVANSAGTGALLFRDPDGEVVGAPVLRVSDVAAMSLVFPRTEGSLLLMSGGREALYLDLIDGDRVRLFGYGAIDYAPSEGVAAMGAVEWVATRETENGMYRPTPEAVVVTGEAVGPASVAAVATSSGATLRIDLEVVDESAVSRIALGPDLSLFGHDLRAEAYTATGQEIHGIRCEWEYEVSSPDIIAYTTDDGISFSNHDETDAWAEVTCRIGEVSRTLSFGLLAGRESRRSPMIAAEESSCAFGGFEVNVAAVRGLRRRKAVSCAARTM